MKQLCLGIIVAVGLTLPAFGQGVDPLVGSWKLNVEKSTFINTPPPKSLITTWTGEGQNFINTTEGVDAQGQPIKIVYQHVYDGQPHPTTGSPVFDGNTLNAVRFKNGKPVLVGQGAVVPGKTYTFTQEGIDLNNRLFHSVLVFDRQ